MSAHPRRFKRSDWTAAVLLTGLGLLSYFLLVNVTGFNPSELYRISPAVAVLTFCILFNLFGFSLLHIRTWLSERSPFFFVRRHRIISFYIVTGFLLLLLNTALLILLRHLAGAEHPFQIRTNGTKSIALVWTVEMVIVSLSLAFESARRTHRLLIEKEEMQKLAAQNQLSVLQRQIDPHFLFNSLNTLIAEITYDPQNAVRFTRHLSDVYRYILQQRGRTAVRLEEEIRFLDSYLFLHRVRLGNAFEVHTRLSEETLRKQIPTLALQIVAENVFKHNRMSEKNPVIIRIGETGEQIFCTNTRQPRAATESSGIGLANLDQRCRLICGRSIETVCDSGTFTVRIPLLYE